MQLYENLESEGAKKFQILRKSAYQKIIFDIFTVGNLQNNLYGSLSLLNILMIFGIKEKSIIFYFDNKIIISITIHFFKLY